MSAQNVGPQRAEARIRPERRTSTCSLRWPEQRSGFDRRCRQRVTKLLRDNIAVLAALVIVLNVLNALDLTLTTNALSLGAFEANPLMGAAFSHGWQTTLAFKLGSMLAVTGAVLGLRRYRRVLQVAVAATALYTAVIAYHLAGASFIA